MPPLTPDDRRRRILSRVAFHYDIAARWTALLAELAASRDPTAGPQNPQCIAGRPDDSLRTPRGT